MDYAFGPARVSPLAGFGSSGSILDRPLSILVGITLPEIPAFPAGVRDGIESAGERHANPKIVEVGPLGEQIG